MLEQKYTSLSERTWKQVAGQDMTPEEAIRYFSTEFCPRTFGDVLRESMRQTGVTREVLVERLSSLRGSIRRDSVRRRLSAWLDSSGRPTDREELFRLCYALNLDEGAAREFLRRSQEGDVHLREPREAGYLYGLRTKKTYGEIKVFLDNISGIDGPFPGDEGRMENYTQAVAASFAQVQTDEAFKQFFLENKCRFGRLHNTAYREFMRFLTDLSCPDGPCSAEQDEAYSIEKVVDMYLRMGLPAGRETSGYSPVQKAIKRLWPNATAIKNMRNRKIDVNRKTLLLLYLVTEGMDDGALEESLGWEEISPEDRLEEHAWNIDLMLRDCGFGALDPRTPFDWLILYSLRSGGDEEAMSDRLSAVLSASFAGHEVDGG